MIIFSAFPNPRRSELFPDHYHCHCPRSSLSYPTNTCHSFWCIFFFGAQLSGHIIAHCCEYFKKCGAKTFSTANMWNFLLVYGKLIFSRMKFFFIFSNAIKATNNASERFLVLNNFWFFDVNANFCCCYLNTFFMSRVEFKLWWEERKFISHENLTCSSSRPEA
jgi:hypothetical protein